MLSDKALLDEIKQIIENKIPHDKSNEELVEFWLDSKGFSKGVKRNYAFKIRRFHQFLAQLEPRDWNLQDVTAAEIESFKIYLERTTELGMGTKFLYWKILKSFYEFYEKQARRANIWKFREFPYFPALYTNPGERDIENKERRISVLTPEETKLYLRRLFRLDKEFYLFERFQYESGLRFIDVARMKKKNLRLHKRHLFTEGRRGFRCYFLSEELIEHVEDFILQRNGEHVFEYKNKQIKYNTYLEKLKRVLKIIDFPKDLSTKSGRKSFSTNRFKFMKQSKPEISLLLGHQIKNVTDRYIELDVIDYLEKFDKYNFLISIF